MDSFDQQFQQYQDAKGKKNSFYIYVCHQCPQEELVDHLKNQKKTISTLSDGYKRKLFGAQYQRLLDLIQREYHPEAIISEIFLVGEGLDRHQLAREWSKLLHKYSCPKINFCYDDHFDLEWLKDYLTNDDPYHLVNLNNNRFNHICLTKTKKATLSSTEDKALTLSDFVAKNLEGKRYLLYGTSSKMKGFQDPKMYCMINGSIPDSEMMKVVDRIDNQNKIDELKSDLEMLNQQKTLHRIRFKTEITESLRNGAIARLYLTPETHRKLIEGASRAGIELPPSMVVIDPQTKSFQDGQEQLIVTHGSVVGVTYY
jgi:hypothetical protein